MVSVNLFLQTAHRPVTGAASRSSSHLLRWLVSLGGIGIFAVAVIDSSMIPLPLPGSTDLMLLLLTAHRYTTSILAISFVAWATAGSIVGGYLTWATGKKRGVTILEKHVPARYLGRLTGWVERYGALTVGVAALLPPPIPLLPFLLAAGALGITRKNFLISYGVARTVRYSLIGWLGFTYGRHVVRLWRRSLANWSTPILSIYGGLVALGVIYGLWKYFKERRSAA